MICLLAAGFVKTGLHFFLFTQVLARMGLHLVIHMGLQTVPTIEQIVGMYQINNLDLPLAFSSRFFHVSDANLSISSMGIKFKASPCCIAAIKLY